MLSWQFIHQYDPLPPKVGRKATDNTIKCFPRNLSEPPFCDPPFEEQAGQLPAATDGMAERALEIGGNATLDRRYSFSTPISSPRQAPSLVEKTIDEGERRNEFLCEATTRI
jgi:hypothetical protein